MLRNRPAILESRDYVNGKRGFAVAARDDRRSEPFPVRDALELVDAVVEQVEAPINLIEIPGEIAPGHLVHDGEKVRRFRMSKFPAREIRGEDFLQRGPTEMTLQRIEPQSCLAVRDRARALAGRKVSVSGPGSQLTPGHRAESRPPIAIGLSGQDEVFENERHEAAEVAALEVVGIVHFGD